MSSGDERLGGLADAPDLALGPDYLDDDRLESSVERLDRAEDPLKLVLDVGDGRGRVYDM